MHVGKPIVVQSLFVVQGCAGDSNEGANCWPQKPQKTNCWPDRSADVLLDTPVVSAKGIGRLPMNAPEAGGQSWLVG